MQASNRLLPKLWGVISWAMASISPLAMISCSDTQVFTNKTFPSLDGLDSYSDSSDANGRQGPSSSDNDYAPGENGNGNENGKGSSADQMGGSSRDDDSGNATEIIVTGQLRRSEIFQFGKGVKSDLVDYLVVLDNSCSMNGIGEKVASGFMSLATSTVLPGKAKIAVMTTMHGDPSNLNTTGVGIRRYNGIDSEPGFLDFVNRSAIQSYREASPQNAHKWQLDGCEEKWMAAGSMSEDGQSCVLAATQSTNACVGAEAGARAFSQLMDKNKGRQLFRRGAVLNVIFVSDTHDPGTTVNALAEVPSYKALASKALSAHNLAGVKFHAIAPSSPCTFEGSHNRSYHRLAQQSDGLTEDPCRFSDYDDFMARMAKVSGEASIPVFSVSKPIKTIHEVLVNGQKVNNYRQLDRFSIEIPSLVNGIANGDDGVATVEVDYTYE